MMRHFLFGASALFLLLWAARAAGPPRTPQRRKLLDGHGEYILTMAGGHCVDEVVSAHEIAAGHVHNLNTGHPSEAASLLRTGAVRARILRRLDHGDCTQQATIHNPSEDELLMLRNDTRVHAVEENALVKKWAKSKKTSSPTLPWHLDRLDQAKGFYSEMDNIYEREYTGVGVRVYVLDTGIRKSHSEFAGGNRVQEGYNIVTDKDKDNQYNGKYISSTSNTLDCDGHGTHCASSCCGKKHGTAPGATIVPVRIFDCTGEGPYDDVIQGINWVRNDVKKNKYKRVIMSISLGGDIYNALNFAAEQAVKENILVIAAAGNFYKDACKYSPVSATGVVGVGATDKRDLRAEYSNWGSCVDIWAPGSDIWAAMFTGDQATMRESGTSMAAPITVGVAAQFWEKWPNDTPDQIRARLINNALPDILYDLGEGSPNLFLSTPTQDKPDRPRYVPMLVRRAVLKVRTRVLEFLPARFGTMVPKYPTLHTQIVKVNPLDGCNTFSNAGAVRNKVAYVARGGCPFVTKATHAAKAGALMVLVGNNEGGNDLTEMDIINPLGGWGTPEKFQSLPTVSISQDDADWLVKELTSKGNQDMSIGAEDVCPAIKNENDCDRYGDSDEGCRWQQNGKKCKFSDTTKPTPPPSPTPAPTQYPTEMPTPSPTYGCPREIDFNNCPALNMKTCNKWTVCTWCSTGKKDKGDCMPGRNLDICADRRKWDDCSTNPASQNFGNPVPNPTPRPTQRNSGGGPSPTPRPRKSPTPRPSKRPTPNPTRKTTKQPTQKPTFGCPNADAWLACPRLTAKKKCTKKSYCSWCGSGGCRPGKGDVCSDASLWDYCPSKPSPTKQPTFGCPSTEAFLNCEGLSAKWCKKKSFCTSCGAAGCRPGRDPEVCSSPGIWNNCPNKPAPTSYPTKSPTFMPKYTASRKKLKGSFKHWKPNWELPKRCVDFEVKGGASSQMLLTLSSQQKPFKYNAPEATFDGFNAYVVNCGGRGTEGVCTVYRNGVEKKTFTKPELSVLNTGKAYKHFEFYFRAGRLVLRQFGPDGNVAWVNWIDRDPLPGIDYLSMSADGGNVYYRQGFPC